MKLFNKGKASRINKEEFEDTRTIGWNLYNEPNVGTAKRNFYQIHHRFKLLFAYPLLAIAKKFMKLELEVQIPPEKHNKNLTIFNNSFEKAAKIWFEDYLPHKCGYKPKKKVKIDRNYPYFTIKNLMLKMILKDSVHREFFNIFSHEFARSMLKEYSGKNVKHLFYTDYTIYNVAYFVMTETAAEMDWSKPLRIDLKQVTGDKK